MRICLVSQEYPPESGGGGIGTLTYLKAHALADRGHHIHVLCAAKDKIARTYADRLVTIHRIPEPTLTVAGFELSTYWLAYSFSVAEKLTRLSQEVHFDIIEFPEYGAEGFVYQTDTFQNRTSRYVVHLHGPIAMFTARLGWPEPGSTFDQVSAFMEQAVLRHADCISSVSRALATFCVDRYGCNPDAIRVLHSGVDTDRFQPNQETPSDRFPRILFVGNIAGNKGISGLVNVVLRLRDRYPNILLRAIGKPHGGMLATLRSLVEAQRAVNNVEFLGYVSHEELPTHYAWCDLMALPSHYEGFANVYLEAMSCGKPVIGCTTGGTPEAVIDGATGLLVAPGDAASLEEAIVTLSEDAGLRTRMGKHGAQHVRENFSLEKYADRVEMLYRGLLSE
jgi:glycosyltransferase involved in cell wall biosynthesis